MGNDNTADTLTCDASFPACRTFVVDTTGEKSREYLETRGWSEDASDPGRWWRGGTYVRARAGVIDIKGVFSPQELISFAVVASLETVRDDA